jgi:hypothetical protein
MDLISVNQSFSTKQNKMGFSDDDEYDAKVKKMLEFIPVFQEFQRMLVMSPKDFAPRPKFTDAFLEDEWERARYLEFREWNEKCLFDLYEDEREPMEWLCDRIAQSKVGNMDMEACCVFVTQGFYFDNKKRLVIYNGR